MLSPLIPPLSSNAYTNSHDDSKLPCHAMAKAFVSHACPLGKAILRYTLNLYDKERLGVICIGDVEPMHMIIETQVFC